jgi:hypothetical protein
VNERVSEVTMRRNALQSASSSATKWRQTVAGDPYHPDAEDYPMGVDAMGEWVAWTESNGNDSRTAFKHLASPANMPPYYIRPMSPGRPYGLGCFAAWTDDGNMLFVTGNGFAIVSKEEALIRQWTTENSISSPWAAWRRYGHP